MAETVDAEGEEMEREGEGREEEERAMDQSRRRSLTMNDDEDEEEEGNDDVFEQKSERFDVEKGGRSTRKVSRPPTYTDYMDDFDDFDAVEVKKPRTDSLKRKHNLQPKSEVTEDQAQSSVEKTHNLGLMEDFPDAVTPLKKSVKSETLEVENGRRSTRKVVRPPRYTDYVISGTFDVEHGRRSTRKVPRPQTYRDNVDDFDDLDVQTSRTGSLNRNHNVVPKSEIAEDQIDSAVDEDQGLMDKRIVKESDTEMTAQCILCEAFPPTVSGYIWHQKDHHATTLAANGIYLKCTCGLKVTSSRILLRHSKECDGRDFTLHKLDEE